MVWVGLGGESKRTAAGPMQKIMKHRSKPRGVTIMTDALVEENKNPAASVLSQRSVREAPAGTVEGRSIS